ncbi:hypothetical protein AB4156_25340 [Cupriavidus sp. 2MCAB6]|uniref:hypothetical protein n=1 Tax=Cupriavidus sp. 2MCAB6 TaxID=3232981 RepID=UPI003F901D39
MTTRTKALVRIVPGLGALLALDGLGLAVATILVTNCVLRPPWAQHQQMRTATRKDEVTLVTLFR